MAFSLPCNHILCEGCMMQLDPRKCPQCREPFELDDVEKVTFTATEQWDELLRVAAETARLMSTDDVSIASSEVDNEVPFIDDDNNSE